MSQRQKRDGRGFDNGYMETYSDKHRDRRRSRSRSNSCNRSRQRTERSYSRSRSRSLNSTRQRHIGRYSRSRSRSRSSGRRNRYYSDRRHKSSRGSYSRSRSPVYNKKGRSSQRFSRSPTSSRSRHDGLSSRSPDVSSDRHTSANKSKSNNLKGSSLNNQDRGTERQPALHNLPLPHSDPIGIYYNLNTEEPIDKERIHKEIEEKLRQALAKEGKVYPPPKPEASHPVFANDGSFLEVFKKMQESQQKNSNVTTSASIIPTVPAAASVPITIAQVQTTASRAPPMVGRRRGGKILKTGVVEKPKTKTDPTADPKDFWSLYLAEVNKYKNNACESDSGTRPLVK